MTTFNLNAEHSALLAALREQGEPGRAAKEKAYLKSDLRFHGVTTPEINALLKTWRAAHRQAPPDDVAALAGRLWASDWHEERTLGIFLLQTVARKLTLTHLPLIEQMLHEVNTWAHLDEIAVHVVGPLLANYPAEMRAALLRWATHDNFWVRRTALLAHLLSFRANQPDFALFETISAPMLHEGKGWSADERFFIRKAIGWALRELATRQPALVVEYVNRYRARMSGLTFREATRKLPPEWAARVG